MKKNIAYTVLVVAITVTACSKSFTERPAIDQPTSDNFYTTAEQVKGATGMLYGYPWFDYNDKALHCIGEVLGGNMYTGDPAYAPYLNFTVTGTDPRLSEAWNAFYKIVGWANVLINTFEQKKSQGGSAAILDPGIAEARFIRGVGFFYIGRIWGDAPIVTDPGALSKSGNFQVPRYLQKDVLRFALEDFRYAEQHLPDNNDKGRITKYSAKGMMAKLYLYRKDYDSAKLKAGEVITSQKYDLTNDYAGMFNSSAQNNNTESMFALQWAISNDWGTQNSIQAYVAPGNLLTTGDGWSAVIPSLDLLRSYESGDQRRKWSVMEQGSYYPQWKPQRDAGSPASAQVTEYNSFMAAGYKYDTASTNSLIRIKNSTRSNSAKYIVGPGSASEPVLTQKTQICTYLLRFADVLLIYAEAALGDNASTADGQALAAFNRVRIRAGLLGKNSITKNDILHERRVEFAFEGDYWFDVQRQGYNKAKQIIEAQERGTLNDDGSTNSLKVSLNLPVNQLFLPIPLSETVQNPKLTEPAIPYY